MTEGEIGLNTGAADDAPVVRFTAQLPSASLRTPHQWCVSPAYSSAYAVRTAAPSFSAGLASSANNRSSTSCSWISGMALPSWSLDCPEAGVLERLR